MEAAIPLLNTVANEKSIQARLKKLAFGISFVFHSTAILLLSVRPHAATVAHVVPTDVMLIKPTIPTPLKRAVRRAPPKSVIPMATNPEQVINPAEHREVRPQSAADSGGATVLSNYLGTIIGLIDQKKKYPASAQRRGQEGRVVLSLKLAENGEVTDARVLEPCPFADLNDAALETAQRIKKFPAIPPELKLHELILKIPVDYKLQ